MLLPIALGLLALYVFYYCFCLCAKPKLYFNRTSATSFWNDKLKIPKILNQTWRPPFLLGCSHLQNFFYEGIILRSHEVYYDERIEMQAEDGGIFALDIKYPEGAKASSKGGGDKDSPQELKTYRSQFKSLEQHSKTNLNLKLHDNNRNNNDVADVDDKKSKKDENNNEIRPAKAPKICPKSQGWCVTIFFSNITRIIIFQPNS